MTMHARFRGFRGLKALALCAALAGLTGCVSMDEYKRLDAAFQQAKNQLDQAENDLAGLRQQIDALKAQLAAREGITGGIDALRSENALLRQKIADLQSKYDELLATAGKVSLPPLVDQKLRDLAAQYPDLLEYDAALGRLRFKSDLTFELGSTEVRPQARAALQTLAGILNLKEIAENQIRIVGHTDDVPIRQGTTATMNPNNWFLSTNRAHAVREVLHGYEVTDTRLQPAGDGPTQPIAANAAGHKGNEKNRRVEIFILPTTVPPGAVPAADYDSKTVVSGVRPAAPVARRPAAPARNAPRTPPSPPPAAPLVPLPAPLPGAAG